jgi:hypothetical protein
MESFDGYLFVIYSCKKYLENANKIYNYLNNKLNNTKIIIIYGENMEQEYKVQDHYLILNVPDDYYSLNLKTYKLLFVLSRFFSRIKGVIKCDDDIIPNINSLQNFIFSKYIKKYNYCGKNVNVQNQFSYCFADNPQYNIEFPRVQYCGGPVYYLSRYALDMFKNGMTRMHLAEDVMVGMNLNEKNIYPINYDLYTDNENEIKNISYHNKNRNINIITTYFK